MSTAAISSRRLVAAIAVGAVALALAACGDDTVDQDSIESGMLSLAQETADVESASCPGDISAETGTEFECIVTNAEGEEVPVVATITGEEGDDILFEVESIDGVDITP